MKINFLLYAAACLAVLAPAEAFAGEGHETSSPLSEFRIGYTEVKVRIDPPTFTEGKVPRVEVVLLDSMSKTPVLDAEAYIFLEEAGKENIHAGHTMPGNAGIDISGEPGLDFGESSPVTMSFDLSMFKRLQPQQMAGVYTVSYPLSEKGDYRFTLAIKSLDGRRFAESLIYGGTISYTEASRALFYRMIFVMGLILISVPAGIWIMSQRKAAKIKEGQKLNILDIPWIKRFLKSAWFQPLFQIPMLIIFLLIMAAGLFDIQQGDRNIATLLMWTIWWAAIIFTFVFAGRAWCMTCPVGAVQDWAGRLFSLGMDFPKSLRNIWLSSFMFFALTWWNSYSGLVNKPALTSYLLIGFFVVALGMAFVFKGRSFCRYVCPIGGLIGIYSMFSPIELRNRCLDMCRKHKVKECVKGTENSHPCPMFETPMTLDRNNYCNFCSECIKSCSQDNIVIRFRSFAKDLWVSAKGYTDEAYLAIALVGITAIVTGEMGEPWHKWMDSIGKVIPLNISGIATHKEVEKITFLVVLTVGSLIIPVLLLFFAALAVRKATGPESPLNLKDTLVQFAYMFIPVGLSMHLAHNISHLFKEGPGIIPAFQRLFNEYTGLNLGKPDWEVTPLLGAESIFWLQMITLIVLNIFSLYAGYRIALRYYDARALKAFVPMATLALFFMLVNAFILGQPMALRHTH